MDSSGGASGFCECGHCGYFHIGPCPRIKAIEYYPDGTVKRVEYIIDAKPADPQHTFSLGTVTMFPPVTS